MKMTVFTSVYEFVTYQEKGELMESEDANRSGKGILRLRETPDKDYLELFSFKTEGIPICAEMSTSSTRDPMVLLIGACPPKLVRLLL